MMLLGRKLTAEQISLLQDETKVYIKENNKWDGSSIKSGVATKKENRITKERNGGWYDYPTSRSIETGDAEVFEYCETDEMELITFEQALELEDGTVVFADDEDGICGGVYIKQGDRINNPFGKNGYVLDKGKGNVYYTRQVKLYIKKQEEKHMFKIGDKVKVLYSVMTHIISKVGTVVDVHYNFASVEFDKPIDGGHNAGGKGKEGCCWNLTKERLELVKETKADYSVGDRVRALKPVGNANVKDATGKSDSICIEFDKNIDGHSGGGNGRENHCWWLDKKDITPIKEEKVSTPVEVKKPYGVLKTDKCLTKEGYSIGDRVVVKLNGKEEIGTIIDLCERGFDFIGVAFDNNVVGGHDCEIGMNGNVCKYGHGRWRKPEDVRVIEKVGIETQETLKTTTVEECVDSVKIEIKGRKITVAYKGFKGVAKCNPDDTFNESYGIGLALERLGEKLKINGELEIKKTEDAKIPVLDVCKLREFLDGEIYIKFDDGFEMREFLGKLNGIAKWRAGEDATNYIPRADAFIYFDKSTNGLAHTSFPPKEKIVRYK